MFNRCRDHCTRNWESFIDFRESEWGIVEKEILFGKGFKSMSIRWAIVLIVSSDVVRHYPVGERGVGGEPKISQKKNCSMEN